LDLNGPEDLKPNGKSNGMNTPQKSLPNIGQTSQDTGTSGTLFDLTPLTSSAADSHVRTFQLPTQKEKELEGGGDLASGENFSDSFANYDQNSSSWRTRQICLTGDSELLSENWPRSGIVSNGIAYRLPSFPLPTLEIGHGLWPTPMAWDGMRGPISIKELNSGDHMITLVTAVRHWTSNEAHGPLNPQFVEWLMGFPIGWTDLSV